MTENSAPSRKNKRAISNTKTGRSPTKKKLSRTKLVHKKAATISCLPIEILKKILCYVDARYLYKLQLVCSLWKNLLINDILDIKQVELPYGRKQDALEIFSKYSNHKDRFCPEHYFVVYRTPYVLKDVINATTISRLIDVEVDYSDTIKVSYEEVFKEIKQCAIDINSLRKGEYRSEIKDLVWKCILAITGMDYSLDDLKEKRFNSETAKSIMKDFTWYRALGPFPTQYDDSFTIAALYPDKKTIAVLEGPYIDTDLSSGHISLESFESSIDWEAIDWLSRRQ